MIRHTKCRHNAEADRVTKKEDVKLQEGEKEAWIAIKEVLEL